MTLTPGTRVGSCELLGVLGVGGMGELWRARDTKLNRDVAIEVMPDAFARDRRLDAWVRDLEPHAEYLLQRAVDAGTPHPVDAVCSSESWLTLGAGASAPAILTDDRGTGRASFWRAVPPSPGSRFDIHFRIVEKTSGHEDLRSDCYQYVISL